MGVCPNAHGHGGCICECVQSIMQRITEILCREMPRNFQWACELLYPNLLRVSQLYLHDYDDNEVCIDVNMCDYQYLEVNRPPFIWPFFIYPDLPDALKDTVPHMNTEIIRW